MSNGRVGVLLAPVEAVQLTSLIDDFRELLDGENDAGDPAVDRLTPSAYPDDDAADADFRAGTRRDLLDRRLIDAEKMRAALVRLRDAATGMTDEDLFTETVVEIDAADIDAWLRTLTAIRLVVATRLDIVDDDDDDRPAHDDRYRIYDWLGYRLESMVQAADELD